MEKTAERETVRSSQRTRMMVMTAVFAALACVATMVIKVPSPTGGYMNLGDTVVLLGGYLLGPAWGALAGSIGPALADVLLGSAIYAPATLVIKAGMAALAAVPLLCKAAREPGRLYFIAMAVFALSMVLLYAASTTYHTVDSTDKVNRRLRKLDHMMIFVLIAGSYTPICLITLRGPQGTALCAAVWAVALAGIAIKALWITCPKWFSSVLYIAMGWLCVFAVVPIVNALSPAGFGWLLAGGIIYTAGGVLYALKLPLFNARHKVFGTHEIFHVFVMAGSACHYVLMYFFVMPALA